MTGRRHTLFAGGMSEQSKGAVIAYWVFTALLVVSQGFSGVGDLVGMEALVEGVTLLGYPEYILLILGPAKILGVIVIALPGKALWKEWAYTGFCIDFIGAGMSHFYHGDGLELIAPPLVLLVVAVASYKLRPADRRLAV